MNPLKINWKDYVTNAQNYSTNHWVPDVDKEFLDHLLPILASIPLQKVPSGSKSGGLISASRTLELMPEILETPNGTISGNDAKCILGFLYYIPRGKLMKTSMIKAPKLGGLTPLAMYAHKLYHKVPYSSWYAGDKAIKWFIGRSLEPIAVMKAQNVIVPLLNDGEFLANRKTALTHRSGSKFGQMAKLTEYKCVIDHLEVKEFEDSEPEPYQDLTEDGMTKFYLPKIAIQMVLQLWLANASLRDTHSMILQPHNWDLPPDAKDAAGTAEVEALPWT